MGAGEREESFSVGTVERILARAVVDENENQEQTLIRQQRFGHLRLVRLLWPAERHH